jgi:hypothetical protein
MKNLRKDMMAFYKKQPVAALVIGGTFAVYALGAFGYGYVGGKVMDKAMVPGITGIDGYRTW